jgi:taurine--2-oxoglutarate transaminase
MRYRRPRDTEGIMTTTAPPRAMTGEEIVALCKRHTLFEWSAQSKVDPIPVARAKGVYFWTPEGKRYTDMNSQLMCTNIGHGDERVIRAIAEQAQQLAYANPFMATQPRARLGEKLAEITPGDIDTFFFTNGGAEANENAIKAARFYTGRHKVLARYRSYHGGTAGAIVLTGDPRRWASEPGMPGIVRIPDFHRWGRKDPEPADAVLRETEDVIRYEGAHTIAAILVETVVGTNGLLIPPDGYMQGLREICDRHGILLIVDEVMAGFGRTGEWFAVDHWKVVPDIITMAKGLTSAYVPLGAVGLRPHLARHFQDKVFYGGLTYNSHTLACATALATIAVYEADGLIEKARRTGRVLRQLHQDLEAKHPSVGATRSIGLFGLVELVRDRKSFEPLAPYNGTSEEMAALARYFRENGIYTFVRWNTFFTNPPLCISESELREAFAVIDKGLEITDRAVRG